MDGQSDEQVRRDLEARVAFLTDEVELLRRDVAAGPQAAEELQVQLGGVLTDLSMARGQNDRLAATLREARDQIITLKEEVDRLGQPPNGFGTVLEVVRSSMDDEVTTVDLVTAGRKLRVAVSPEVEVEDLVPGREVMLNEAMNVVSVKAFERSGEVWQVKDILDGGDRALVTGHTDDERVIVLAAPVRGIGLKAGDSIMVDGRTSIGYERVPKAEVEELVLEEVPDISYADIGGLKGQIESIRDAVELPFLHKDLFAEHKLKAPKGILLYGPPGCGKTLIAKAVANSLAKKVKETTGAGEGRAYFINVKGPELLNKFVGETERQIRLIFQRAREKASAGTPVIVFFDEMESLFRTRGTGVSSDMENTIVPQLLAEIDGVEKLENVIIIGASNREDMIDPAILRPGRLDVKIKVERPDAEAARDIFAKYVTPDLPLHAEDLGEHGDNREATCADMIQRTVERMYAETEENRFLEVTYANGDKEVLFFKDFNSGAMIENIVARAKKMAVKDLLENGSRGIRMSHLFSACTDEFKENEDLPNTTNPDDWARISGKKGERIVFIRTLITGKQGSEAGKHIDTVANTGQYL
jgi:proteasome-associated ATPase